MSKAERDDIRIEFTDASREIHGVMSIVCHKILLCMYSVLIVKPLKMRYTGWKYRECCPCKTSATTVTSVMGQYSIKWASMAKICLRDWTEQQCGSSLHRFSKLRLCVIPEHLLLIKPDN